MKLLSIAISSSSNKAQNYSIATYIFSGFYSLYTVKKNNLKFSHLGFKFFFAIFYNKFWVTKFIQ